MINNVSAHTDSVRQTTQLSTCRRSAVELMESKCICNKDPKIVFLRKIETRSNLKLKALLLWLLKGRIIKINTRKLLLLPISMTHIIGNGSQCFEKSFPCLKWQVHAQLSSSSDSWVRQWDWDTAYQRISKMFLAWTIFSFSLHLCWIAIIQVGRVIRCSQCKFFTWFTLFAISREDFNK